MLKLSMPRSFLLLQSEQAPLLAVDKHDIDSVTLKDFGKVDLNFFDEGLHSRLLKHFLDHIPDHIEHFCLF